MERNTKKKYVFLDTNINIHFQDFTQIKWLEYFHCEEICIVFAPIVLSELDSLKYDRQSDRKRERARLIDRLIDKISNSAEAGAEIPVGNNSHITLRLLTASPDLSSHPGLRCYIQDDILIASILDFKSENFSLEKNQVILITDDNGLKNKARSRNIETCRLNDADRLPNEPTIEQEKIKKLEQQIKYYESVQPNLDLVIIRQDVSDKSIDIDLQITPSADPQYIIDLIEEERKVLQVCLPGNESLPFLQTNDGIIQGMLSGFKGEAWQADIERYQKEVNEYLEQYKDYLIMQDNFRRYPSRSCSVLFQVINTGNVPGNGVFIKIVLPEEIEVAEWLDFEQRTEPVKPSRPIPPSISNALHSLASPYHISQSPIDYPPTPLDNSLPQITCNHETSVIWERPMVMHNIPLPLTKLTLVFPDRVGITNYKILYEIHAENLGTPRSGVMNVNVNAHMRQN